MRVAFLNPMFGKDFTKSARWFARSRGRVQRHPDYFCTCAGVVEAAGHEIYFLDAQAKNMPTEIAIQKLKAFAPDMVVYQATTPSIYADIEAARLWPSHRTGSARTLLRRATNDARALAE